MIAARHIQAERRLLPPAVVLHSDDIPLWEVNAQMDIKKGRTDKRTLTGILTSLENLGHAKYPHVEGLTVELHDYQKQAVGFMLDREKKDNRKLLWAQLPPCPGSGGTKDKLYFSPMLGCFSREPEAIGKGGFLCEEMGLGKTVISLATILSNPAPALPLSCATVAPVDPNISLNPTPVAGWSPHVRLRSDDTGSMYHRGTLVVCHVSLVGQWIDEAKKKLKDPGLVYPYHGSSRTKDTKVLGQKSIVVTTYATLSSDDNYHRKKHTGSDPYVPICGKFKWWRIILDESHAMKSTATMHSKSIKGLVAENRWCVTGTPFNNNLADISNQMAFLNIAPFTSPAVFNLVFGKPYESLTRHNVYQRRRNASAAEGAMHMLPKYAIFLALMRSFMMRHSKDQKSIHSNLGLVSLPTKTQKTILIDFVSEERRIYGEMEKAAKAVYLRHRSTVMKNTLYLLSTMTPLRDVCSGGAIPTSGGGHACHQPDRNEIIGAVSKSWLSNPTYQMTGNDSTECAICLDILDEPVAVMCNPKSHVFCRECIEGIIVSEDDAKEGNCPLCRIEIKLKNFRKAEMPVTGVKEEKGEDGGLRSGLDLSKLKGLKEHGPGFMFDSKLKKLVAELKRIAKEEPKSKSLIFSQVRRWAKRRDHSIRRLLSSLTCPQPVPSPIPDPNLASLIASHAVRLNPSMAQNRTPPPRLLVPHPRGEHEQSATNQGSSRVSGRPPDDHFPPLPEGRCRWD